MATDCSWCRRALDPGDCWELADPASGRGAAFCRLEHLVPWTIRGPRWGDAAAEIDDRPRACSHCGAALGDDALQLMRRRAGHTFTEWFCGLEHAAAWAKAGGPWAR